MRLRTLIVDGEPVARHRLKRLLTYAMASSGGIYFNPTTTDETGAIKVFMERVPNVSSERPPLKREVERKINRRISTWARAEK